MSKMKYTTKVTLYNSYFDLNNRLTAKSILSIFQDVASIHAEEIGVGYEEMLSKNLYWVLSRIKFDIIKMPKINETVIVETWPLVKGRIDFDRDMRILSEEGETLIIATSKWCVIDATSRMLTRSDNVNYIGEYSDDKNYEDKFNKIILPNEEMKKKFEYKVRFSDLDHNEHMNNTNYAHLVLNAINNTIFNHFEINFINECRLDDNITLFTAEEKENYVIGRVTDKVAFIAYIE